jgi:hypothetical protein
MVRHHYRIAAVVGLTLALATAAPASARFLEGTASPITPTTSTATANPCSEVCSGGGYTSANQAAQPAHDAWYYVALAGSGYGYGNTPVAKVGSPNAVSTASAGAGFHWDDAGIGAGGALALMVVLIGGVLYVMNARRRTTARSA